MPTRRRFLGFLSALGLVGLPAQASTPIPPPHTPQPERWRRDDITVAWIGHSTVLIRFFDTLILTDPVLFNRVGVSIFGLTLGPARLTRPALQPEAMPTPDIVLLSHAHMDHMDRRSLEFLTERAPGRIACLTARNTADVIEDLPWKSLDEADWGEHRSLHDISFEALPVRHFGWRLPGEGDRAKGHRAGRSFNAWLLRAHGRSIVFGGDTAYTDSFAGLADRGGVDVAIMPIGAYDPWIAVHCTPEEAVRMAAAMKARCVLPIHTMTFRQGREAFNEPMERFLAAVNTHPSMAAGITNVGQTFSVSDLA
ncbi:MAG: MBL fold metallo-hydrolase [Candidatus Kapabacteria bacterium]|jgi:L-ascorbate metabolism protein UlaG (beta-lactamase superfamily)|nr:MBL fold metallo-hydrolase [Candidatus Kapabacteria bacterium]